jgi:NAD dependent epimerase/dehydratase family enzyme
MKVAITGASGLLGSALVPFLRSGGHAVLRLVRRTPKAARRWDPRPGRSTRRRSRADAVVNLSGENLAGGPGPRAQGAPALEPHGADRLLAETSPTEDKPKVLVSVSTGYYGNRAAWLAAEPRAATSSPGVRQWEQAARRSGPASVKSPRLGVVLAPRGRSARCCCRSRLA